jgi:O-antigen/teichoic acid export membrane protein
MGLIKKNIVANIIGSAWQAIMGLIFVPIYVNFMGIESWGLVGVFAMLQVVFSLLDMGLSGTLNREMARLSILSNKQQEMRNLVRTLEIIYWGVAILSGIATVLFSPFIANNWINTGQLSPKVIEQSILIMGCIIVIQLPLSFYTGGLLGLQKQVVLNVINASIATLRGIGAIFVLWLISPNIKAFLLWQIIISTINVFFIAIYFWRHLPVSDERPVFEKKLFFGIWRFTVGMSGIAILSVILTQIDKIILSKMLSLEMFGYYTLASVVAINLTRFFSPIFYSIYPRFTQLVSINNQEELTRLYHKSCQFMSVLVLPAAIIIALFSYEILLLWTRNQAIAEKSYIILSILVCGTAINGIMNFPYALQLAFGWTSLSFFKNVIAVVLVVPLIIYMAGNHGAVGAASVWLILNLGYFFFEITIIHRKLLIKEKWRWYWQDVCLPLIACAIVAGLGRMLMDKHMNEFIMLIYLIVVSILTFGVAVITTPVARSWLFKQLLKVKLACGY